MPLLQPMLDSRGRPLADGLSEMACEGQPIVHDAASSPSTESWMDLNSTRSRFGSGRDVKRIEDQPLLKGQGRFTDNLPDAGHAVLAFVRSPHGHVRIVSVDTAPALALPAVLESTSI